MSIERADNTGTKRQPQAWRSTAQPNYEGLPLTVIAQRMDEIVAAQNEIAKLGPMPEDEEAGHWESSSILSRDEVRALLEELGDDLHRYHVALKKMAQKRLALTKEKG